MFEKSDEILSKEDTYVLSKYDNLLFATFMSAKCSTPWEV
jgi:hypothetical protein